MGDDIDHDLDAVLDDAAFGFYQGGSGSDVAHGSERSAPVVTSSVLEPATANDPDARLIQTETHDQSEPKSRSESEPESRSRRPLKLFDPLAKQQRRKGPTRKDDRREQYAGGSLSDRLNDLSMSAPDSTGASNAAISMEKTLEALGIPTTNDREDALDEGTDGSGDEESSALVDMIMRQLLSKDVLYEPMKEIGAKYPGYLASHRDELPAEEVARYEAQQQYIDQICAVYESGEDRYDELMELLQGMQGHGNPPEAIMGELSVEGGLGLGGLFGGDVAPDEDEAAINGCPMS